MVTFAGFPGLRPSSRSSLQLSNRMRLADRRPWHPDAVRRGAPVDRLLHLRPDRVHDGPAVGRRRQPCVAEARRRDDDQHGRRRRHEFAVTAAAVSFGRKWRGCAVPLGAVCLGIPLVDTPPIPRRDVGVVRVNYPALLAPSRLAAVGHSSRAGLYRTDIVPRDPMRGRGPASFFRPRAGRGLSGPPSTVAVDCPAGLIPGVLALYPQSRDGS